MLLYVQEIIFGQRNPVMLVRHSMTMVVSPLPKGQLYKPRPELFMILVLGRLLQQQLLDRVSFHRPVIAPSKVMMAYFRDRRQTRHLTSPCVAIWPCLRPHFGQVQMVNV